MKIRNVEDIQSIEFRDVSIGFDGQETIFEELNYTLQLNQNIRIAGDTGIGKSLLLKLIIGLMMPQKGEYLLNGKSVQNMSFEEFTPYRLGMGYSFEFGGLMHNKTLLENIILTAQYHTNYFNFDAEERALDLMKRGGIYKSAYLRPSMVPGSHRKMTILLRAFLTRPQILLLDEPAAGLNDEGLNFIVDLIAEEKRTGNLKNVLFVTNNQDLSNQLTESSICIMNKKIGLPTDVKFREAS